MRCRAGRAARWLVIGLLAGVAVDVGAVVFTMDYNRLTVLPVLTGSTGDLDWRTKGSVTPVKNEGPCDSSWAFGVTGLVEADYQIRKGMLFSLSEQELLDCTDLGSGCGGGSPARALEILVARGGLAASATYPYTAREGTCKTSSAVATIPGAGWVPPGDEVSLQNYVARGPVLALVDASTAFNSYKAGIFTGPCSSTAPPTQAVLIVGYTATPPGDFWIVKNSLGRSWGSQGYIFMARGQNLCGIANFAIAASNDPVPAPAAPATPVPALSPRAVGVLVLGLAAFGLFALRGHSD